MGRFARISLWAAVVVTFAVLVVPVAQAHVACTPGFWKNHLNAWPSPYTPDTTLKQAFAVEGWSFPSQISSDLTNATLLQALQFQGGPGIDGAFQILMRAATAALLNAQEFGAPPFEWDTLAVIADVHAAMPFGETPVRDDMLAWAMLFDYFNNAEGGCPLGGPGTM